MENKVIAKEYVDKIEIWKDIKDYEGLYQVSNLGNYAGGFRWKYSK